MPPHLPSHMHTHTHTHIPTCTCTLTPYIPTPHTYHPHPHIHTHRKYSSQACGICRKAKLHLKIFLEHKERKMSIRKFQEVQRRKFALTPLQLAPQAHQGSFGPLPAPAASVSVFTYVHTQPQGFLLPQMGSYLGILGKVNSSSPQTLLSGPSISLQPMEAGPGRQTCRRAGAGSVGAGRPLAMGQGTSPANLVKLQDTGETLCNSPPFLGSGRERSSCVLGNRMSFWPSPRLLATMVGQVLSPLWERQGPALGLTQGSHHLHPGTKDGWRGVAF